MCLPRVRCEHLLALFVALAISCAQRNESPRPASPSQPGPRSADDGRKQRVEIPPLAGHSTWIAAVAFSPSDRRIATAAADRTLAFWDVSSGKLERRVETGEAKKVVSLAFVEANCPECSIHLHDTQTGALVRSWPAAKQGVSRIAFVDDRRIAVGAEDGEVSVWDATTGSRIAADGRHRGTIVDMLVSGAVVITASRDTSIHNLSLRAP